MDELLKEQQEIIKLLKMDRFLQVSQSLDSKHIAKDEDNILDKLNQIHDTVKKIESKNVQYNDKQSSFDIESRKNSELSSKQNLEQLKKIQEAISYKNVADKAINEPIFKSFSDKFRDIGKAFQSISSTLSSGNLLKTAGRNIASAVSPRYKDQLEYIKAERNLGNVEPTDKQLKIAYKERSQLLQRNVANEEMLKKEKGKLTQSEFLKGGSKIAEKYIAEKTAIGEGLKARDSRYRIDEKIIENKQKTVDTEPKQYVYPKKRYDFEKTTSSINENIIKKASVIPTMIMANRASVPEAIVQAKPILPNIQPAENFKNELNIESKVEAAADTKKYQDVQLENDLSQTKVLKDQLETQNKILEVVKDLKNSDMTSDGTGIDKIIKTAGDTVSPNKGSTKLEKISGFLKKNVSKIVKGGLGIAGGMAMEAGGDALTEAGHEDLGNVVSTTGSAVEGATTGAMLGSVLGTPGQIIGAGAGAIMGAAQGFSDTFGEGGLELINDLRSKDAISYPIFGTTPKVENWDIIEKLPSEQIQTLIGTNEFEGKDLEHLKNLLLNPIEPIKSERIRLDNQSSDKKDNATFSITAPKPITPEIIPPKPITPEIIPPNIGNRVYEESYNNSNMKNKVDQGASIINAPTNVVNTTNNTQNSIVKSPIRNTDNTILDYLKSRYA